MRSARALALFADAAAMRRLRLNGMRADVSWRGPAKRYAALYRAAREGRRVSEAERADRRAARRHAGRDGRRRRGLSAARERGRFLPVRRRRRARDRAHRADARRRWRHPRLRRRRRGAGARYGLRVDGPFDPARGHRFDAAKLLADPYALRVRPAVRARIPRCSSVGVDSGAFAPKAIVARAAGRRARPPAHRLGRDVIYEAEPARLHHGCDPDDPGGGARTLRRPRASRRRSRICAGLGVTSGRDHAGRRLRRRAPSAAARAVATPGATTRSCSARPTRASRRAAGRKCARRPTRCTRPGIEVDARHRAQPQRRERRIRPDDLVPRPRQRRLFPPAAGRSGALHQRHGLRQLPRARPAAGRAPWRSPRCGAG